VGASAAIIAALTARVDDDWADERAHEALLGACAEAEQLAAVATWYRSQTAIAERSALAENQLRRLTTMAMLRLEAQRPTRRTKVAKNRWKVAVIVLFLGATALMLVGL
jgi:hypothetical protein